jgi:CRISPR system Cascade subunit CasB
MTTPSAAAPAVVPSPDTSLGTGSHSAHRRQFFWERFSAGKVASGEDLAALRRGIGREAGSVPAMWPYYTTLRPDGARTAALNAEHVALTLFAVLQQSKPTLVHRDGIGLGTALLRLRQSGRYSADAVDRRFAAAATATSLTELAVHVRGLVTQLRQLDHPELDLTRLTNDLRLWQNPEQIGRVRRHWGAQYFAPRPATSGDEDPAESSTAAKHSS